MLMLGRCVVALVGAGCCGLLAFLWASRLLRGMDFVVRTVASVVLVYWMLAWSFQILGVLGGFELGIIVPLLVLLPTVVLLRRRAALEPSLRRGREEVQAEIRELRRELRSHPWDTAGLSLVGAHLALRMFRTLATPAFGWDDFTYHLFRAGRWVQSGGLILEPAPDAWTYYEFFPWGGDLLWAWALVWRVGDVLVPVTAILLWCVVPLMTYAVVRQLDQSRMIAVILAMAVGVIPSQAGQISTAYVDNAVLAMVLGASLFLLLLLRHQGQQQAVAVALMAGICIGLGLLVKMSFLPLALPAALMVLWHSARSKQPQQLVAFCAGLSVTMPNWIFNWIQRGSPFYPFEILSFLPYNHQHSWILSKYGQGATAPELARAAKALVINLFPLDPFLNVGFLGLVLVLFGLMGTARMARAPRGRWFLLWVAVGAGLTIVSFFSPRNSSMVVWWALMMGRFLVPSLAGLMVVGCLTPSRWIRWVLVPLMVVEYFVYARRGWPTEQVMATIQVAALVGLMLLIGVILKRLRIRVIWRSLWLAGAAALVLVAMIGVRERYRYDAYRLFAERRLMDFHGAPPVSAWPIWQRLDETGPSRVAATAGFDGHTGHNWFRSPLLGASLQNEVLYLPVTSDGRLISYRDREAVVEAADRVAWLRRLRDQRIDRVVALGPANVEHRWILESSEIFDIEVTMGHDRYLLARVDQEALELHLKKQAADEAGARDRSQTR